MVRRLLATTTLTALAACGSGVPTAATPKPVPVPIGRGAVVGGINPCQGIPEPGGPRYAAGTVTVLQGQVTWTPTGPGESIAIFPATAVAETSVTQNGQYRFVLTPGHYVLRAQFPAPANVMPWADVTVVAGATQNVDIPNMCK